jgi:hypothetical protein
MDKSVALDHNLNHVIFNSFDMSELLLLLDGLMKAALVVCLMVLVATAPSNASARSTAQRYAEEGGLRQPDTEATSSEEEPDRWRAGYAYESLASHEEERDPFEHTTNIDGTPMCGDVDINGNVYGITESLFDAWGSDNGSSMFD